MQLLVVMGAACHELLKHRHHPRRLYFATPAWIAGGMYVTQSVHVGYAGNWNLLLAYALLVKVLAPCPEIIQGTQTGKLLPNKRLRLAQAVYPPWSISLQLRWEPSPLLWPLHGEPLCCSAVPWLEHWERAVGRENLEPMRPLQRRAYAGVVLGQGPRCWSRCCCARRRAARCCIAPPFRSRTEPRCDIGLL